jgi:hypothetical protein
MAQILIAQRAPQINTGNQTLQPVQFQMHNNGIGQAIQGVGQDLLRVKANLIDKTKDLDNMSTLIDQSDAFQKEDLHISKWQQQNLDHPETWEDYSKNRADNLYTNYDITPPTDPESRLKFDQRHQNWSNNILSSTFTGTIKTKSSNFIAGMNAEKDRAFQTGDFSTLDDVINQGHRDNIFSTTQADGWRQVRNNLFNKKQLDDVNNHVQMFVDAKQYGPAKDELLIAKKHKLIGDSEYDAQISKIDHQYDYNNKIDILGTQVNDKPDEVLTQLKSNTVSVATNIPAPLQAHIGSFEKYGAEYNVDPNFLLAVSMFETGNGNSSAFRNKNNATGISNDSGVKNMESVDDSIRVSAKAISGYKANTIEGIGSIYSPVGAVNDPNHTNGEWASGVRAKYKEITGQDLPDNYNPKEYAPLQATKGEYSWLTPADAIKTRINAETQLSTKANSQFQTLKSAINLGQIKGNNDHGIGKDNVPTIDSALMQKDYSSIGTANDNRISVMRDAIKNYANKTMQNDPSLYQQTLKDIINYGTNSDKDISGIGKASIGNKISAMFSGHLESELNDRLTSVSTTAAGKRSSGILADAITALNTDAFDTQVFGSYKKPKMISQDVPLTGSKYWLDWIPFVNPAHEKTNVPLSKKAATAYTPSGTEVKQTPTPILEEDPYKKEEIAGKVKLISDEMHDAVTNGLINNKIDAMKLMRKLSKDYISIDSPSNVSIPSSTPKATANDGWKKAQQYLK